MGSIRYRWLETWFRIESCLSTRERRECAHFQAAQQRLLTFLAVGRHGCGQLALALILASTPGCALHYCNRGSGQEHIWGIGQLRLEAKDLGLGYSSLTAGSKIPGLAFGIGADHIGVTVGFLIAQRLTIAKTSLLTEIKQPSGWLLISTRNGAWGIGHVQMHSLASPCEHETVITGNAIAGLKINAGYPASLFHLGLDTRQLTTLGEELQLTVTSIDLNWPYFDLFNAAVSCHPEPPAKSMQ